ncbi:RNA polymerase sigma factor [Flavivirga eckloniae]|uniref:RNA polymerase sigma-70 factor n=1 Tax=Flavivirga eckloniae TaxID=1803846 RepID=A0A2K9PU54_9FLAO|nr:RNA polymerase sigma-70 factor [Flavivirga eckloniae]AUP80600.1 hypothetical protein C1H87_18540 [Flavivirga eckloniae]
MNKHKQNISLTVASLKKGDELAFKAIYSEHSKELNAFINSFTKNQMQTDDILQDTFIKLWNGRERLDEKSSISSFLRKTAYNTFVDKYRKKKREQSMLDGWLYKRLNQMITEDEDIRKKKIKLVQEAIEKLPPRCKEIFLLSKFEHLKYAEIAEQLNISIKTVEVQMGNAFKIIRKEIESKNSLYLVVLLLKHSIKKIGKNLVKP